ncbi:MAG: hypothetical protein HY791_19600 [Deltaproteobacteria bacterium]|nr:hypothetical protein [Deltaproteobacteria bacterium]
MGLQTSYQARNLRAIREAGELLTHSGSRRHGPHLRYRGQPGRAQGLAMGERPGWTVDYRALIEP